MTVEGLAMHAVQERIAKFHGSQCGFCTPGIVMSLYAAVRDAAVNNNQVTENGNDTLYEDGNKERKRQKLGFKGVEEETLIESLDGNLCRCTGYKPILDAARTFASCNESTKSNGGGCCKGSGYGGGCCRETGVTPDGFEYKRYTPDQELIFPPALKSLSKMPDLPIKFGDFYRPTTKYQVLELLRDHPDAKIVAGASEVQIEMKFRGDKHPALIYVGDVKDLSDCVIIENESLEIGANITLSELEETCKKYSKNSESFTAIAKQLKYFAGRQVRNAATPAGNIATASPIADLNPILVAIGAILTVESAQTGESRKIKMEEDFFTGYRKTQIKKDELITRISIPWLKKDEGYMVRVYKQAKRKDDDISIVTCAIKSQIDFATKIIKNIVIVYGGVAALTVRAKETEKFLVGKEFGNSEVLESAINVLMEEYALPYSVPGGMPTYRRTLLISFLFMFFNKLDDVEVDRSRHFPEGKRDLENPFELDVVGKNKIHLSALKQVTGEAVYVDDIPPQHNELFGVQITTSKPCGKILSIDVSKCLEVEGVVGYVDINDLPNKESNMWGSLPVGMEQFFTDGESRFLGQCIGVLLATDRNIAEQAARLAKVEYDTEGYTPIISIEDAIENDSFFDTKPVIEKGDIKKAFEEAEYVFEGVSRTGAQEHFYLETQGCLIVPEEDGEMKIYSSTQNPTEAQTFASQVTGSPASKIVVKAKRLGGGFGGKESRSVQLSSIASVAAKKYKRPIRMILSRSEDMLTSGYRHPFLMKWKVALDKDHKFLAIDTDMYANGGWSLDLTRGVLDRAVWHACNCYHFSNARVVGHACKTNTASNTAFRGFGGPQAMYMAETIIYDVSERLGIDPDDLRRKNYYVPGVHTTHYKQSITEDFVIPDIEKQLKQEANYDQIKKDVEKFNESNQYIKRGVAHVPTMFGIAFGALFLNQAGALVHIYHHDGSILLAHGGTEMGQGLHLKMSMICAQELQVPLEQVFISETATNTVANTSATAASASSDLNGMAVKNACDALNARLAPYREKLGKNATMKEIAHAAYWDRVNLSANGFYKTPDLGYVFGDPNPKPAFSYFTQGCAICVVEANMLTGDWALVSTQIKMDIGRPINKAIDYGQIEGAFVQGVGLFTMEEMHYNRQHGSLFTRGPGQYKIPGFGDCPKQFDVSVLRDRDFKHLKTIRGSKGVGEPPLFLGSSALFALRNAVEAYNKQQSINNGTNGVKIADDEIRHWIAPMTTERIRGMVNDEITAKAIVVPKKDEKNFFTVG